MWITPAQHHWRSGVWVWCVQDVERGYKEIPQIAHGVNMDLAALNARPSHIGIYHLCPGVSCRMEGDEQGRILPMQGDIGTIRGSNHEFILHFKELWGTLCGFGTARVDTAFGGVKCNFNLAPSSGLWKRRWPRSVRLLIKKIHRKNLGRHTTNTWRTYHIEVLRW